MPTYKRFSGDVSILVEIEGEGEQTSGGSLTDAMGVVSAVASSTNSAIHKLSEKDLPQEIEISFGLKAVKGQSSFTVVLGEDTSNFRVKLKWSNAPIGELIREVVS